MPHYLGGKLGRSRLLLGPSFPSSHSLISFHDTPLLLLPLLPLLSDKTLQKKKHIYPPPHTYRIIQSTINVYEGKPKKEKKNLREGQCKSRGVCMDLVGSGIQTRSLLHLGIGSFSPPPPSPRSVATRLFHLLRFFVQHFKIPIFLLRLFFSCFSSALPVVTSYPPHSLLSHPYPALL